MPIIRKADGSKAIQKTASPAVNPSCASGASSNVSGAARTQP